MTTDEILRIIFAIVPFIAAKLIVILLMLLHLSFSVILLRQTKLMNNVVEAQISPVIYMVSLIHLLFSIFTLLYAIILL